MPAESASYEIRVLRGAGKALEIPKPLKRFNLFLGTGAAGAALNLIYNACSKLALQPASAGIRRGKSKREVLDGFPSASGPSDTTAGNLLLDTGSLNLSRGFLVQVDVVGAGGRVSNLTRGEAAA